MLDTMQELFLLVATIVGVLAILFFIIFAFLVITAALLDRREFSRLEKAEIAEMRRKEELRGLVHEAPRHISSTSAELQNYFDGVEAYQRDL